MKILKKPFVFLLIFLLSMTAQAAPPAPQKSKINDATATARTTTPKDTNLDFQAGIYTETHAVYGSQTAPTPKCSLHGTYTHGSMVQNPADPNSWIYECYVQYTYGDLKMNPNFIKEAHGWNVISDDGRVIDQATLQYPNGFPETKIATSSCFSFGGPGKYYSFKSVTLSVGGKNQNAGGPVDTCGLTATVSQVLQPYGMYQVKKEVWGQSWYDSCTTVMVVMPNMIGQTIHMDCCPQPGHYAAPNPNVNFGQNDTLVRYGVEPCP